jgi:hypothetical protein
MGTDVRFVDSFGQITQPKRWKYSASHTPACGIQDFTFNV